MQPKAVRIETIALETSRSLQMCSICTAGTQPAPCKELQVVLTDCYPVISDRVCQVVLFASGMKHSAHCAQVHKVRSAYVNNALACLKP